MLGAAGVVKHIPFKTFHQRYLDGSLTAQLFHVCIF